MDNQVIKELKEAAETYLHEKEMSRADLARQIEASEAIISQLFKDSYPGNAEKYWRKIAKLIGFSLGKKWYTRSTQNLATIQEMCRDAQENSKFIALSAKTDTGKTHGLQYYKRKAGVVNTYYVLCDVNMTRKGLLCAILRSFGLSTDGSIEERMDNIIKFLDGKKRPLLLLDDAGKLNDSCMRQIQIIYDRTEANEERHCGIVIAGVPHLELYIRKMAGKGKMGFDELLRRVEYWQPLTGLSPDFIYAVAADYGITDKDALKLLHEKSTGYNVLKAYCTNYSDTMSRNPVGDLSQREVLFSLMNKAA